MAYTSSNSMTQADWEEVDRSSRIKAEKMLACLGATNISGTVGVCSYDLSFQLNGTKFGCELKFRNLSFKRFKDVMIENDKFNGMLKRYKRGEYQKAIVINMYPDNTLRIANAFSSDFYERMNKCQETSEVKGGSKDKIFKSCRMYTKFNSFKLDDNGKLHKFVE